LGSFLISNVFASWFGFMGFIYLENDLYFSMPFVHFTFRKKRKIKLKKKGEKMEKKKKKIL